MAKRHRISRGHSRRMFTRGARRVHPVNAYSGGAGPMRGGIRL